MQSTENDMKFNRSDINHSDTNKLKCVLLILLTKLVTETVMDTGRPLSSIDKIILVMMVEGRHKLLSSADCFCSGFLNAGPC